MLEIWLGFFLNETDILFLGLFVDLDEDTQNEEGGFFWLILPIFKNFNRQVPFSCATSSIGSNRTNKFSMRQVFKEVCGKDFLYIKFVNMD